MSSTTMRKRYLYFLVITLLVIFFTSSRFKDLVENFSGSVSGYYNEKLGCSLFLHTDKSTYIPNESIWFKAYILDSGPLQHEVLYLRLINEQKQIVLHKEFLVYDIRSNGDMLIPITMPAGRYKLVAYTDKMINFDPENIFVQQIQVAKDQSSELKAEALITDSADFSPGKKPEIIIKITTNNHETNKARGTYQIYTSNKKTIKEGNFTTGITGITSINFDYPVVVENEDVYLQCKITAKGQSKEMKLRLPRSPTTIFVNCYPESGHLVNGISNDVLVTTTDADGAPVSAKVILKSQAKQIATTTTNTNGHALIAFIPDMREKYSLVVNNHGHSRTVTFPLKIDPAGYVIHLTGTQNNLAVMVKNQNMQGNVVLLGRTLSELKLNKPLTLKSGDSILVPLPPDSLNHLIDLGLFDEHKKLMAERLAYLRVPERYHVAFQFDKAVYSSREKVRANITVTDTDGNPVIANLSVAVAATNTYDPSDEKRITDNDVNSLKSYPTNMNETNAVNNALIKENIRSGSWESVMSYIPAGKINTFLNSAGVFGYVVNKKKKKIDLKTLYFYSKSGITAVPVDANGMFSIQAKDLVAQRGETKYLIVNPDFNNNYDLHIKNYASNFDTRLLIANLPERIDIYDQMKRSDQTPSLMLGRILREVTITAKKSTEQAPEAFNVTDYHSANCSDFVCFYNILNCKNHPGGGAPPTTGQIYVYNGRPIRYYGCSSNNDAKKNIYPVKNIDSPQAFYLPDYAKEPISTPELQSTIFWEPNLNTQIKAKSSIEFYTSDVNGSFTIVVQGIAVKNRAPINGKSTFIVTQGKQSINK